MKASRSTANIFTGATIGIQEAADYLDISRLHLVRLLKRGEIPFSKAGTDRQVKVSDLVGYKRKLKVTRRKQLNFLAKQAQELNLGYSN